ncbi:Hypothetical Protein FCC1311_083752 [Hondaea fermentalgiana]|uniref:Centrosomin N-terminal motif 1 domain-containing protein n=1 Tax=Hondaea fermentalgiana TaxID=2315210 RepID=A0A2R5GMN6_9STRA|nr:Hypothetical Protein FCC1311_083752 [Hondaea fermentalgiana]|eukprot:GBG32150.1 Hypothetical Protein FCC1311_083752 [Hondaea fermentalgiana]
MDGGSPPRLGPAVAAVGVSGQRGELEKLSKENFNLKLRIFYLEERVAKLRKGGETDESLEQEVLQQKVLLEEKQQELDERNLLLVKARNAIEGLQTDLALCSAELDEARNVEIPVELLREKEQEIDALRHKIRELDERDRKRLEDVLTLNEQVRELEPEKKRAADLDLALAEANSTLADAERALLQRDARIEEIRAEHTKLARENETLRAQVVEGARALGEQRSQEAEAMSKLQETARNEEARVNKLTQLLKQCEQERDQSERAAALAERKTEELARELEDARAAQDDLQATTRRLERDNARLRETYATKEHSLRREGDLRQQELRHAQNEKVLALTSELAQLKGKVNAVEFARDEAYRQVEAERSRAEAREAEASEARAAVKDLQNKLAIETKASKEATAQLRESLANSVNREKEFQRQVRLREVLGSRADTSIQGAVPDHASFISSSSSLFGDDLVIDELADHRGERASLANTAIAERPEPRTWVADESGLSRRSAGPRSPRSQSQSHESSSAAAAAQLRQSRISHTSHVSHTSLAAPAGGEVVLRLEDLQDLKNLFTKKGLEMERKWRAKLKRIADQLERAETQLEHAESKLGFFMQSMQSMANSSSTHLKGQARSMEKRYNELLSELRSERKEKEDRVRVLEARAHRSAEEKEALHDQLGAARERAAVAEGEARQIRAELEAVREEKYRLDKRLEELHGAQSTVEECNRVLSLELEDRGRRVEDLTDSQNAMKHQLRTLRDELHAKKQTVATLERKLDHAARKLEARDSQLRESKSRLDRALLDPSSSSSSSSSSYRDLHGGQHPSKMHAENLRGHDEFERKILRQVKETERAIQSSGSTSLHRVNNSFARNEFNGDRDASFLLYEALCRGEDTFAGVLDAVAALVEKTHTLVSRHGQAASYDLRDLLSENQRLALDVQRLGKDMYSLHQRLRQSIRDQFGKSRKRQFASGIVRRYSGTNGNLNAAMA